MNRKTGSGAERGQFRDALIMNELITELGHCYYRCQLQDRQNGIYIRAFFVLRYFACRDV